MGQYKEGEKVGSAQELAHRIFTTVYMGTVNSGSATKDRARNLAKQIGADHLDVKIDLVIDAMAKLFEMITGRTPKFRVSLQILVGWAGLGWAALRCAALCCAVLCCLACCCVAVEAWQRFGQHIFLIATVLNVLLSNVNVLKPKLFSASGAS